MYDPEYENQFPPHTDGEPCFHEGHKCPECNSLDMTWRAGGHTPGWACESCGFRDVDTDMSKYRVDLGVG